jgi:endonuclease YncB( thermonuclease family)
MTDEAKDRTGKIGQSVAAALLMALLLLSASAQPRTITGKVVGVSDGDTITVLDASNRDSTDFRRQGTRWAFSLVNAT